MLHEEKYVRSGQFLNEHMFSCKLHTISYFFQCYHSTLRLIEIPIKKWSKSIISNVNSFISGFSITCTTMKELTFRRINDVLFFFYFKNSFRALIVERVRPRTLLTQKASLQHKQTSPSHILGRLHQL